MMTFYLLLDYLAAQVGPEKMHFVAECRWNKSWQSEWALRRLWGTLSRRGGDLL